MNTAGRPLDRDERHRGMQQRARGLLERTRALRLKRLTQPTVSPRA